MFARGAARAARRVAGTSGKSLAPIRRPVSRAAHGINRGIASTAGLRSAGMGKISSARQAMAGKHASRYVAGGVVGAYGIGAIARRQGPAADKPRGRPTGMYGY